MILRVQSVAIIDDISIL